MSFPNANTTYHTSTSPSKRDREIHYNLRLLEDALCLRVDDVCACVCVSKLSLYSLVENIITAEYMKVINKNVITLLERCSFSFMFMVLLNCTSDLGYPHWNIWSGLLETPVSRKAMQFNSSIICGLQNDCQVKSTCLLNSLNRNWIL